MKTKRQVKEIPCILRPAEMTSPEKCAQCNQRCVRNSDIRKFLSRLDDVKIAYLREQKDSPINPIEAVRAFSIVRDLAKRYWKCSHPTDFLD
ncbi:MAG: hypothetical protein AB1711_09410 [Thermodesulfobacteriota bacterium]